MPNDLKKDGISDDVKQKIIEEYLKDPGAQSKLAQSRLRPGMIDYHSIAKKTFLVEELPSGALPVYDRGTLCFDANHAGFGNPVSECQDPECMVLYVMES